MTNFILVSQGIIFFILFLSYSTDVNYTKTNKNVRQKLSGKTIIIYIKQFFTFLQKFVIWAHILTIKLHLNLIEFYIFIIISIMHSSPNCQEMGDIYIQESDNDLPLGSDNNESAQAGNSVKREVGSRKRQENTLSSLSKKFTTMIKNCGDKQIDLNRASLELNVQKRRLYDIVNVLEGIGYIQRVQKNIVRWIGGSSDPNLNEETESLEKQIKELITQEKRLDQAISFMNSKIQQDFSSQNLDYNYINQEDILDFLESCHSQSDNAIIIQPKGKKDNGTISVTQNMLDGRTQIMIMSESTTVSQCMGPNSKDKKRKNKSRGRKRK